LPPVSLRYWETRAICNRDHQRHREESNPRFKVNTVCHFQAFISIEMSGIHSFADLNIELRLDTNPQEAYTPIRYDHYDICIKRK